MLALTLQPKQQVTITLPDGREAVVCYIGKATSGRAVVGFDFPREYEILRDNAKQRAKATLFQEAKP